MEVNVAISDNKLNIQVTNSLILKNKYGFLIDVEPSHHEGWNLNVNRVTLKGQPMDSKTFIAVWKAFNQELLRNKIKDDLVQLNGYYQYEPKIKASMKFETDNIPTGWVAVKMTVEGNGIGKLISKSDLAQIWGIKENSVQKIACFLKELGYEIRNHNTNVQIPRGYFLIPYCFPTLTPLSVQLNKKLEA